MHNNNTAQVGASVPKTKVAGGYQTTTATSKDCNTDFTQAAAFLEVLTRIAEALEKQNERLEGIRSNLLGINLTIQDAGRFQ